MADASYELVEHPLRNGISMIALREKGSESFIESLNRGKTRQRAAAIVRSIERLLQNGLDWGFASKTVKRLHGNYGDIVLYETWRAIGCDCQRTYECTGMRLMYEAGKQLGRPLRCWAERDGS